MSSNVVGILRAVYVLDYRTEGTADYGNAVANAWACSAQSVSGQPQRWWQQRRWRRHCRARRWWWRRRWRFFRHNRIGLNDRHHQLHCWARASPQAGAFLPAGMSVAISRTNTSLPSDGRAALTARSFFDIVNVIIISPHRWHHPSLNDHDHLGKTIQHW